MFPCMGVGVFTALEQYYKGYNCGRFLHILANSRQASLMSVFDLPYILLDKLVVLSCSGAPSFVI